MKRVYIYIFGLLPMFNCTAFAQDDTYYDDLLKEEVERVNPVYKPAIGGGVGMFGFVGDVKNNYGSLLFNKPAYKLNVSTFVNKKKGFRANFTFLTGTITANERSYTDLDRNLNFESEIFDFGINIEYGFGDLTRSDRRVKPFISLGVELFNFNSKSDMSLLISQNEIDRGLDYTLGDNVDYHYWSDGTIRDLPEQEANIFNSSVITRDFQYETSLRDNSLYRYPEPYSQTSAAIPFDLGFDFVISDRFTVRLGSSLRYTFTDFLDHLAPNNMNAATGNSLDADSWNDMFTFTYVTVHLDLFSESKTYILEKLVEEVDFDYIVLDDSDGDNIMDITDECPDTPLNVPIDSVGCPFDDDYDGVPNYLDKEPNTPTGAYVDHEGVQLSEDELIALLDNSSAVARKDIELYIQKIDDITYSRYYGISNLEIPDKFRTVDNDGDGYISFDEVLDTIDEFFEFESTLSTDDIYELNEFFFAQ